MGPSLAWVVGEIAQKLADALSKLSGLLGRLGRLGGTVGDIGNRASRPAATGVTTMDDAAGAVGRSSVVRDAFAVKAGSVNSGVDAIGPSGFNYNSGTGSIDFERNLTGDAVKAGSALNKDAAQVDDTWEEQRRTAEREVRE